MSALYISEVLRVRLYQRAKEIPLEMAALRVTSSLSRVKAIVRLLYIQDLRKPYILFAAPQRSKQYIGLTV